MKHRSKHPLIRATAFLAVLGVWALTVLAVSPALHAWVHGHEVAAAVGDQPDDHGAPVGDADHVCAVTFFASGATALLAFCLLMLVRPLARGIVLRASDEIAIARPRYWLVPAHAPPAA
jgi:hypothetical protein